MLHCTQDQANRPDGHDSCNATRGGLNMNNSPFKISSRVLPVVAILALSGCSDLDVFGLFEDDTPAARSASEQGLRDRASTEQAAAEGSGTPSLTSVPSRPAGGSTAVRDRVVEGLISDRDNARYSDEAIRLQGSTRPTATPQAAAAPAPAPAPAPVAPSTTPAPAPASVAPQIAVTPPPAPVAPAPQVAAARPAPAPTPAPAQSQSVVVDMSALGGAWIYPGFSRRLAGSSGGHHPVRSQFVSS